jgi:hypothetical protein
MTGTDQESLGKALNAIYSQYESKAADYIASKTSIPATDIFAWGQENITDESLTEVARLMVKENSMAGLDALLQAYIESIQH